ncbi:hypothetical protein IC582_001673 [Cucumis melo]
MGCRNDEIFATSGLQIPLIKFLDPPKKPIRNHFAFLCSIVASLSSILVGYDIGVMSGAAIYIQQDFNISDVQVEILVGIISLYSIIGAIVAGITSDWLGRRYTIVLSAALFFFGAIFKGFAPNYHFLMFGRFVTGVAVGSASLIASVYTAELAPTSSRGCLYTFPEVFVNVGILIGYVSNFAFSKLPTSLGWRFMLGLGIIPSMFLGIVVILIMPESPRWLVIQGRINEAKQVLIRTSDSIEESLQRLADIKTVVGIPTSYDDDVVQVPKQSTHGSGVWKELFLHPTPAVLHILTTAVGVNFFVEATGMNVVVSYSPRIFEKAGISSSDHKLLTTMGVGITKTVFVLIATVLFDRIGRRPLLLTSIAGKTISLIVLGVGMTIIEKSEEKNTWVVALCVAMVLTDVSFYSIGMGPMCYVISEIFPLKLRSQGVSVAMITNRIMDSIVGMTFLSLYTAITIGGAFFLYGAFGVVGFIFFYVVLPETRGMELEELEGLFGKFLWKFSNNNHNDINNGGWK